RPGMGFAPRPHRHHQAGRSGRVPDRADVRGRRSLRLVRTAGALGSPRGPGVCWPTQPDATEGATLMTTLEEARKSIQAGIGTLTPAKAQELAKSLSDPGTAKEQVSKLAADMLVWFQRSREGLQEFVSREVFSHVHSVGVGT